MSTFIDRKLEVKMSELFSKARTTSKMRIITNNKLTFVLLRPEIGV